jgi:NADH-quinone oxidoreductase subunit G
MTPFGPNSHILLGASALHHPDASRIKEIAASLSTRVTYLTEGANAQGALAANCVPGESGLNAKTMLEEKLKGYLLLNVEPDLDCANPVAAIHAIKDAEFVVAFSSFKNPVLLEYANVILPIAPFTETSGSFINVAGMKQHFRGVAKSFGESRPGWKVLRVLGNFLGLEGFDYASTDEIAYSCYSRDYSCHSREGGNPSEGSTYSCHSREGGNPSEASTYSCHSREGGNPLVIDSRLRGNDKEEYGNDKEKHDKEKHDTEKPVAPHLSRIGDIPIYSTDSLVRRGKALQATQRIIDGDLDAVRLHPNTAKQLNIHEADLVFIKQGDNRIGLSVVFDVRVPVSAAYIPGGISATCGLSELFGAIEIYK